MTLKPKFCFGGCHEIRAARSPPAMTAGVEGCPGAPTMRGVLASEGKPCPTELRARMTNEYLPPFCRPVIVFAVAVEPVSIAGWGWPLRIGVTT